MRRLALRSRATKFVVSRKVPASRRRRALPRRFSSFRELQPRKVSGAMLVIWQSSSLSLSARVKGPNVRASSREMLVP